MANEATGERIGSTNLLPFLLLVFGLAWSRTIVWMTQDPLFCSITIRNGLALSQYTCSPISVVSCKPMVVQAM